MQVSSEHSVIRCFYLQCCFSPLRLLSYYGSAEQNRTAELLHLQAKEQTYKCVKIRKTQHDTDIT